MTDGVSRPRASRRPPPRSRLVTWSWLACASIAGFCAGLWVGSGNGWGAVAGALVAAGITYAVRRPRRMAWLAWVVFGSGERDADVEWDAMRRREIARRRLLAARARSASTPDGAAQARRRIRLGRWRRRTALWPSDGEGDGGGVGG